MFLCYLSVHSQSQRKTCCIPRPRLLGNSRVSIVVTNDWCDFLNALMCICMCSNYMFFKRTCAKLVAHWQVAHVVDALNLLLTGRLHTPIKRGQTVWPYSVTADERLLEFDFDRVVFEQQSPFQLVQIYHSPTNGNVLLLDGDLSKLLLCAFVWNYHFP